MPRPAEQCVLEADFRFHALALEHALYLPSDNLPLLKGAYLTVYGLPQIDSGRGAHDVHLYLNRRDITTYVRDQLVSQLDAMDARDFSHLYADALRRWLDYRAAFGVLPEWLDAQKAQANDLSQRRPAVLLQMLGDRSDGDHGHLSLFNFLYRDLPLSPVDITSQLTPPDKGRPLELSLSSGPSHRLTEHWTPEQSTAQGAIRIDFLFTYSDPLDIEFAALRDDITNSLRDAGSRLASIAATQRVLQTRLDTMVARVDDCSQAIGDAALVDAIRQAVDDIKRALHV